MPIKDLVIEWDYNNNLNKAHVEFNKPNGVGLLLPCFADIKHKFRKSQTGAAVNDTHEEDRSWLLWKSGPSITLSTAFYLFIKHYGDLY